MLLVLFFSCWHFANGQVHCTIILKDRSVIEAYHLGSTELCKKGRKKTNTFKQPIYISGSENNHNIILEDFDLIEEVRINEYKPVSNESGTYSMTITVKFKDGTEQKLSNATLKCKEKNQKQVLSILPIQVKQSENTFQQINVDIRNVETLLF